MTAPTRTRDYVRPTSFEIATCWVHGLSPAAPLPPSTRSPRAALDEVILPALLDGPCFVTFSGGRDSSAILAAATALARREGLADPVPVTRVYPGNPEADESEWQHLVVDRLGLREWLRLEFRDDETDLLGAEAQAAVRRRGVVWPPALQSHGTVYRHLVGGTMLTGEGGDETLGSRRGTPLALLRRRRRPDRDLLTWAGRALAPRPVRHAVLAAEYLTANLQPWLRPETLREHCRAIARDDAAEPLRYDAATWWLTRRRSWSVMTHNQAVAAAEFDVRAANPLLAPGFLAALARFGGLWGFAGRTSTMKALFADILPPAILSRTSKAAFNRAYSGPSTREFAATWDGAGVDPTLVDVERLRQSWLSDTPTMSTALLLHSAWLASQADRTAR